MKIRQLCLAALLPATLAAQQPQPAIPAGPLIKNRAPDFSKWAVVFSPSLQNVQKKQDAEKPEAPPQLLEGESMTEVTKTGTIYHVRFVSHLGEESDVWVGGPVQALEPMAQGASAEFVAPPADKDASNPLFVSFVKSDFEKFAWLKNENFKGIKKMLGRDCLYFADKVRTRTASADTSAKTPDQASEVWDFLEAYVDAETRLPVLLSDASGVETYKFLAPPTAMLVVPKSVKDLLQKQIDLNQSLSRKPAKPF